MDEQKIQDLADRYGRLAEMQWHRPDGYSKGLQHAYTLVARELKKLVEED